MTWTAARVTPDGTHHVRGDSPLYAERFDAVLAFHAPGLAPVQRGGAAWHIHPDGQPAYARRFTRSFGFYEGLAAVAAPDGWHHVHPDGTDLTVERYAWCGNYQGGRCAVRDHSGAYLHLTADGTAAYADRWSYAGDYRDGVAVVQASDGRSSHIDTRGVPVHGVWFLDLDVFHKGFARARDEDGWTHVDRGGRPIYAGRFAAVEPFYNGQARVERDDGGLEVIDEAGETIVELRPALRSDLAALSADMVGFWRTQTLCAAAELGVVEALPGTTDTVAAACGLPGDRAERLLRALAELRVAQRSSSTWSATPRGDLLRASHPQTLAGAAVEYGRHFPALWERLPAALRNDGAWHPPDIFGEVAADPERTGQHHRMLQSYALHDYGAVPAALHLRGDEMVVDAGGGLGALASLLVSVYPGLHIEVLDRPEVVAAAAAPSASTGWRRRAVDLFAPWGTTADVVLMARVVHDWDDDRALALLRRAREALRPGGRLFVIEMLLPEDGAAGGLCDLHLLVATGGAERTERQIRSLMGAAGFAVSEARRLPALPSIIEGVAR